METAMLYHTADTADTPANPSRDSHGRYIKGHQSKGGRPPRKVELTFIKLLRDAVDEEKWKQISNAAVQAAIAGDGKARDWLSSYLLGPANGTRLTELLIAELTGQDSLTERLTDMELHRDSYGNYKRKLVAAKIIEQHGYAE